jgi:hypothetical protein
LEEFFPKFYELPGMLEIISLREKTGCECGELKSRELGATGGMHSYWCPMYKKQ